MLKDIAQKHLRLVEQEQHLTEREKFLSDMAEIRRSCRAIVADTATPPSVAISASLTLLRVGVLEASNPFGSDGTDGEEPDWDLLSDAELRRFSRNCPENLEQS